jgi:hypothetical protein
MADNVAYGLFLLVLLGQNLKYGVVAVAVLAHVAANTHKQVAVLVRMPVKLFV